MIQKNSRSESYKNILSYALPEIVTATILMSAVVDARFIAKLHKVTFYATVGVTSTLMQLIAKAAEGVGVGTVILCGRYNGDQDHLHVGRVMRHAVLLSIGIGACISAILYAGAYTIYHSSGMSAEIVAAGTPYLKLRAIGIALMFVVSSIVGCMRGIKNTTLPMRLFVVGTSAFIISDYVLIFGHFGIPALHLRGSALAYIIQYAAMLIYACISLRHSPYVKKYQLFTWERIDYRLMYTLCTLSIPVMIDKAVLASAKIWLVLMLAPLGINALSSFSAIRDLEQIAFIPAIALAQVVTFLVSNARVHASWSSILVTIKRVFFLAALAVSSLLLIFCLWSDHFLSYFDPQNIFRYLAKPALPILSIFVLCDVVQIILAGAMRGASYVNLVMWTRIIILGTFVIPLSYAIHCWNSDAILLKFILIYGSFYIGNGIMSTFYWFKLTRNHAKNGTV